MIDLPDYIREAINQKVANGGVRNDAVVGYVPETSEGFVSWIDGNGVIVEAAYEKMTRQELEQSKQALRGAYRAGLDLGLIADHSGGPLN